jgi:hypothetical protein
MFGIDWQFSSKLVILAKRLGQFQLQPFLALRQFPCVESVALLQIAAEESFERAGVFTFEHGDLPS